MAGKKEIFELEKAEADLPQLPAHPEDEAPKQDGYKTPPGTVLLTVDQMTFYVVAALVVVFAAYLIGYYASTRQQGEIPPDPTMEVVPAIDRFLPSADGEAEEAAGPPLPEAPPSDTPDETAQPASGSTTSQADARYTLEVIRFKTEDRMVAVITVQKLQKLGYVPAFLKPKGDEIAVCVGKFATRDDKTALRWREEIRNIHRAYHYCEFVPLR